MWFILPSPRSITLSTLARARGQASITIGRRLPVFNRYAISPQATWPYPSRRKLIFCVVHSHDSTLGQSRRTNCFRSWCQRSCTPGRYRSLLLALANQNIGVWLTCEKPRHLRCSTSVRGVVALNLDLRFGRPPVRHLVKTVFWTNPRQFLVREQG